MGTHLKSINLDVIGMKSAYACVNQPNEVGRERGGVEGKEIRWERDLVKGSGCCGFGRGGEGGSPYGGNLAC